MSGKFTFDPSRHLYLLGNEFIPSVTGIISPLQDFSKIPPATLEQKADWGTKIHKMIALYLQGSLDIHSISVAQEAVLTQFKRFIDDNAWIDIESATVEMPMYHRRLKYAGTPDIITSACIIDTKTREYDTVCDPIQLEAYDHLQDDYLKTGLLKKHYVLSLFEDHYTLTPCNQKESDHTQSWGIYRDLLKHHQDEVEFQNKIKIWRAV